MMGPEECHHSKKKLMIGKEKMFLTPWIKKSGNLGEICFLSYPDSWVWQATRSFSNAEVNCRFIDIYQCLSSVLNVFHYEIQCST